MNDVAHPAPSHSPAPTGAGVSVERARASDVRAIKELVDFYAGPILLRKSLANLFEDVTEFWVARDERHGHPGSDPAPAVGCGALHVLWEDLGELRTIATHPRARGRGVGRAVCEELFVEARRLGLTRLFVLTFEVDFFASLGFAPIGELDLSQEAFAELRSSYDAGVAEFLDLPYVKPNTLGNTRMIKHL
ncbi:amino-acid N-acetyltransferase [Nakamurella flavida]|uniref:amino-acid N-acetyltransferase n=1 Tax=Nakamurella flavida TaxID=363630 RepID=UPI00278719E6|nr:amino-acid N-acetyltransferase [Nakamurella flavida]MDP9776846.1 amino-acid N-acetyltransferase [Nakamurella flavida]